MIALTDTATTKVKELMDAEGQPEPGMYIPAGGMKIEHGR